MSDLPILILGGSYAGLMAASRLRKQAPQARIVLIDSQAHIQQRIRWHESLAGRQVPREALAPLLAKARIEFIQARVLAWNAAANEVLVEGVEGQQRLTYRGVICALGSVSHAPQWAGAEHCWQLSFAQPLAERVSELRELAAHGGHLAVIGSGLAGVECASELAERYPQLQVSLIGPPPLADFCPASRAHASQALQRLGVQLVNARVVRADAQGLWLADGRYLACERRLWCGGLRANPLLAECDLALTADGRLRVAADLRVEGLPNAWAAGDCAAVTLGDGRTQRLSCASAMPTGGHAGEALGDWLHGRPTQPLAFAYVMRCVSLGRRDGIWQLTDAYDVERPRWLGGRAAALIKWLLCAMVWQTPRWELRTGRRLYAWARPPVASPNSNAAAAAATEQELG
jgi:NADH dehydrogenase FAD-containing subunit